MMVSNSISRADAGAASPYPPAPTPQLLGSLLDRLRNLNSYAEETAARLHNQADRILGSLPECGEAANASKPVSSSLVYEIAEALNRLDSTLQRTASAAGRLSELG